MVVQKWCVVATSTEHNVTLGPNTRQVCGTVYDTAREAKFDADRINKTTDKWHYTIASVAYDDGI